MGSLRRTRPENLDDLTIQVAIVRPGPIQGGAVNPYIERRQRLRVDPSYEVPYDHPSLEPVLRDTLGTIIFQDQVIEVAMAFAGLLAGRGRGPAPGDEPQALGGGDRGPPPALRRGRDGALATTSTRRWPSASGTMIVGFSGFGFPKAHGAAFGLLAYQSTWLRVHYGPEFLCALLDEQPMGFYPPDALVHEAQRRGIEVLPPDVNASAVGCTVTAGRARCGSGSATCSACAPTRSRRSSPRARPAGPFRSLDDLAARAGAGRPALEQLAWSGACDALARRDGGRRGAARRARAVAPGRGGHRAHGGARGTQLALPLELPDAPALRAARTPGTAMVADYATTGLTVDRPPAGLLRAGLRARGAVAERRPRAPAATARACGSAGSSSRASGRGRPRASSSCCSRTSPGRST